MIPFIRKSIKKTATAGLMQKTAGRMERRGQSGVGPGDELAPARSQQQGEPLGRYGPRRTSRPSSSYYSQQFQRPASDGPESGLLKSPSDHTSRTVTASARSCPLSRA